MKILFVGVLDIPWSTNVEMKNALESLGHAVEAFNYRTIADQSQDRDLLPVRPVDRAASFLRRYERLPRILSSWYFRRRGRREMNQALLWKVEDGNYDLVFLAKTDSVDYRIISELQRNVPCWYYFMDPSDVAHRISASSYARRSTWASATSTRVVAEFRAAEAKAIQSVQGFEESTFSTVADARPTYDYDVVFAGTRTPERGRYIGALRRAGIKVECFGVGWKNHPVYSGELVEIYRHSRIVLNFCRDSTIFSVRVVQAMACGPMVLSQHCTDLLDYFTPGEEIDTFSDVDSAIRQVKRYLKNSPDRIRIADQGTKKALLEHTWQRRMSEIIEVVSGGLSARDNS